MRYKLYSYTEHDRTSYFFMDGTIRTWMVDFNAISALLESAFIDKFRVTPDNVHLNPEAILEGEMEELTWECFVETFPDLLI